jgi:hypothetical protein
MFVITKENINHQGTHFKFAKFIECVLVLQSFDFVIYGSAIYEYIWRCAAAGLPWKRYSSLKRIVETKDISIQNINARYIGAGAPPQKEVIDHFQRGAHVVESFFQFKMGNVCEFIVAFDNPYSERAFDVAIEISGGHMDHLWPYDDLISLIALDRNNFVIYKETEAVKKFLEETLGIKIESFDDPQMWGIIPKIGAKIAANETMIRLADAHLFTAYGTERVRSLLRKGYTVNWASSGVQITMPRAACATDKCSICLEQASAQESMMEGIVTLHCGHQYHLSCMSTWLKARPEPKCALCRAPFTTEAINFVASPLFQ